MRARAASSRRPNPRGRSADPSREGGASSKDARLSSLHDTLSPSLSLRPSTPPPASLSPLPGVFPGARQQQQEPAGRPDSRRQTAPALFKLLQRRRRPPAALLSRRALSQRSTTTLLSPPSPPTRPSSMSDEKKHTPEAIRASAASPCLPPRKAHALSVVLAFFFAPPPSLPVIAPVRPSPNRSCPRPSPPSQRPRSLFRPPSSRRRRSESTRTWSTVRPRFRAGSVSGPARRVVVFSFGPCRSLLAMELTRPACLLLLAESDGDKHARVALDTVRPFSCPPTRARVLPPLTSRDGL